MTERLKETEPRTFFKYDNKNDKCIACAYAVCSIDQLPNSHTEDNHHGNCTIEAIAFRVPSGATNKYRYVTSCGWPH